MSDEPKPSPVPSVSPSSKWSRGSLRILSLTVRADHITDRLGIVPDEAFEHGTLMSPGHPRSARREGSLWRLGSGLSSDRSLDEHVTALLRRVAGKHEALAALSADCQMELFLGFSSANGQGGCLLPAGLLREVGQLGLDIVLDLYPPHSD